MSHPVPAHSERGFALAFSLFVLALLLGMGTTLLFLTDQELRVGRSALDAKRAFFLAEAGLEDGRQTLFAVNGQESFDDDLVAAAGPDNVIDFNVAALAAVYGQGNQITGWTGFDDDVPVRGLTFFTDGQSPGWYAAFLTNDPLDGIGSQDDTNDRVMVTAIGAADRRSVEIVQAILEPARQLPSVPGAALTLIGPNPAFDNGNSNAQHHDGNDCAGAGVPGLFVPIVGTTDDDALADVQGDMHRPDHFESGSYEGEDTIGNLTDPSDPIVAASGQGTIDPLWTDCQNLAEAILGMEQHADYACDPEVSPCSLPATDADSILFVDGDISITSSMNGSGTDSGILIVTGELTFQGNASWDGIILVVGQGSMRRNGGGNGHLSGAVIVADVSGPDGVVGNGDDCTSAPDGFAPPVYHTNGGGNSEVEYCSSVLAATNPILTYKVVEFLQR